MGLVDLGAYASTGRVDPSCPNLFTGTSTLFANCKVEMRPRVGSISVCPTRAIGWLSENQARLPI